MIEVLLKTLPFFALIGLGYGAARTRFFSQEASAALTKFVFYFALSAMLFRFSASLSLGEIFDGPLAAAYLFGTGSVYLIGLAVARARRQDTGTAAIEAQCVAIGNTGFLGVPMLTLLLGPEAIGPIILILAIDLIVFSSLLTIVVSASRGQGQGAWVAMGKALRGLLENPMVVSIALGLLVSASGQRLPGPVDEFLSTLGAAATPGALFAIGASLAGKSAERLEVAAWLSFGKLVLHPALVALGAFVLFAPSTYGAGVAVSAAALPVAGNVYILAQHYGIAPHRVSASILISTVISVVTVSAVIAWVTG
ncbi:MAG: AEC family transporter [Pelagimonas sp.]|jgi:predicted permease|nr:AEC family transporter [Pelagimonas sp.]